MRAGLGVGFRATARVRVSVKVRVRVRVWNCTLAKPLPLFSTNLICIETPRVGIRVRVSIRVWVGFQVGMSFWN